MIFTVLKIIFPYFSLTNILESGWLESRMEREYRHYERCIPQGSTEFTSLGLQHTKGVFLLWAIGIVTSFLMFLCELFKTCPKLMFSPKTNTSTNKSKVFDKRSINHRPYPRGK